MKRRLICRRLYLCSLTSSSCWPRCTPTTRRTDSPQSQDMSIHTHPSIDTSLNVQVDIPRLEREWSADETEVCFSEGLMKAGLASASYEEMAPLDVEIQQLREAFTDAVLRKHWDVLSVAFGMENIKKEDIDEMPAPIFFQVLHDLMYLWVNPHIHQVPARRDWVDRHRYLIPTVFELLGRNETALNDMATDYALASLKANKDTAESIRAQPEG
mmetsp:Transcript_28938/g.83593  ORF Transcript_28938/g.83593 Transcript_28938/m.83593 type:complete len:214 (+) Transcript_28938:1056-1697(+)